MRSSDSSSWRLGRKAVGCFGLALLVLIPPFLARPAAAQTQDQTAKPADQTAKPEEAPEAKVTEEITEIGRAHV